MRAFFATYIYWLIMALNIAIFGRVIMSWISPQGTDPISTILFQITEPILAPIRHVLPRLGMFDFAPMVALLILNLVISPLVRTLLG